MGLFFINTASKQTAGVYYDTPSWGVLPEVRGSSTGRSLSSLSDCRLISRPFERGRCHRVCSPIPLSVHWAISRRDEKPSAGILHILSKRHSEIHCFLHVSTFIQLSISLPFFPPSLIDTHGTSRHLL